ncbi:MAG: alpha/beta fold hydrolase [Nitrospinota bacterium]
MALVNSGGVDIDYEVLDSEARGIPVFFITGLNGVRSAWASQLEAFLKRGPIVLHDHRGTGKSAKPLGVYSVENMAEDVVAIMDDAGIEKAHFVGSSTGGAICQVLCIDHAERVQSACICSSWPKADNYFIRQFTMRKRMLQEMGVEATTRMAAISLYEAKYLNDNYDAIQKQEDELLANAPPTDVMVERIECIMRHDQLGRLGQIRVPVLVAVARDDVATPLYYSEQLAEAIPGAELKVFERGGHFVYICRTEEFNEAILDFIGRHES